MLRPRLPLLLLVLPLAACGRPDVTITAEPLPAVAQAEKAVVAPVNAQGGPAAPELPLPRATNGIAAPGEADKVLPAGGKPLVRLLENGAEPRADLSYALVKGAAQKMVLAMDNTMGMKAQGQTLPTTTIPRVSLGMDVTTGERSPAGEFRIDSAVTSVAVEANGGQQEQIARALKPQLDVLKGMTMGYWVGAKGQVRDLKITPPSGVGPGVQQIVAAMSQSFESVVTPLPAEPVGVGARWQVMSRSVAGGADVITSTIFTLKSRDTTRATIETKVVQVLAADTIQSAQLPAGVTAKVKSFNASGSGVVQVDLKSVAPEGATRTRKTSMHIAVQGGGPDMVDETTVDTTTVEQVSRP